LAETLARPKFDPYVSIPDRQRFFELAIDGNADWIIAGDRDLLEPSSFESTSILTPSAALALSESVF
jgi:predicted nucleic acid-binding protein